MVLAVYSLSNLFRIYLLRKYIQIFLGEEMEEEITEKEVLAYGIFFLVNTSMSVLFHTMWLNVVVNVAGFILIVSLYTKSAKTNLFLTSTIYMIHMGCDVISAFLLGGMDRQKIYPVPGVTTALFIFICEQIAEKTVNYRKNADAVQSLPLIFVPACSVAMVVLLVLPIKDSGEDRMAIVVVCTGLLAINFFVLYLYNMLQKSFHQKYENEMLKHKVLIYANQMNIILENENKVKALKHDMKHHMNELKLLAIKNEDALIQEYIDSMEEFIHNPGEIISSGNMEIDSVLNYMLSRAREELMEVNAKIDLPGLAEPSFDLNVIFGNLLENAIEAARETEEKLLELKIGIKQGVLRLEMKNSFQGELPAGEGQRENAIRQGAAERKDVRFSTKKKDKSEHGFGLDNVRKIVEKHNGIMEAYPEGDYFFVKLMLYM